MIICENKTQSVVIYRFNNGSEKRYKATHALNVEIGSNASSDNKQCYRLEYTNLADVSGVSYICSARLTLVPVEGTAYVWVKDAEGRFAQSGTTQKSASISIVSGLEIPEGQCTECTGNSCSIVFKDLAGNTLYREVGECPIKWNYSCDNECPDGFLKCECDEYPGYCCLPCGSVEAGITSIKTQIESLIKFK
jgi:hypothetical protein